MQLTTQDIRRFWSHVAKGKGKNGCWIWTGAKTKNRGNYGVFMLRGTTFRAHRVSFVIAHGDPGEMHVLHKCDNPPCVRPVHLFLGTNLINKMDQVAKGRALLRYSLSDIELVLDHCVDRSVSIGVFARKHRMKPAWVSCVAFGALHADKFPGKPRRTARPKDDIDTLPLSRERKRQLRRARQGLCVKCDRPRAVNDYCLKHAKQRLEANRKRLGSQRRNNCLTSRLTKSVK